ncbi:VCBS domain-containing protein [Telluria aromaticivorans]|uniref:Tandem-95 repeat protein n=1 Tax=Telluria aromaticivorans TaxID=2725995 RepID=A0A7Y2P2D6_9BURK|nr:VCBS domain-containing protein [Telluria aromaticivorans]NNG25511.1 tandem-95 repeat protein [Telluria aromaticivorans]
MTTTTASVTTTLNSVTDDLVLTGTADINGTGNSRNNVITGNSGANVLNGLAGADTLVGGEGDDTYIVDSGADVVVEKAGEGTDTVQASVSTTLSENVENLVLTGNASTAGSGNAQDNSITGNNGSNALNGGGGNDTLVGNGGNDALDGGSGADSLQGGTGDDSYVIDDAGDVVSEAAGAGNDTVRSSISYGLTDNVEQLILTGDAAIDGTGNALDNVLTGNIGNNSLSGGAGNDSLIGGQGADQMDGGTGNDSYVVDNAGDLVIEAAGAGTDTVQSNISYTLTGNVENLVLTGLLGIDGSGNELNNSISGNGASNTLYGLDGNDSLDGGLGADSLVGGSGDDTYVVENAGDVVVENDGEGSDKVMASASHTLGAFVENLTLTGAAAISGTGNELDNTITGNGGSNALLGGAGNDTLVDNGGNDTLDGGLGADTMQGGLGNDVYVVDDAGDLVVEAFNGGLDTVQSGIDYVLTEGVENLAMTGTQDLKGAGNALNNTITGNAGNNTINADAGVDTVNAGEGDDTVNGGDGNDLINGEGGNDTLYGDAGNDRIDGGLGADRMLGGIGDDTYVVNDGGDLVGEDEGAGIDLVESSITYTLTSNTDNLTLTGTAELNGAGNVLNNVINGNAANNSLDGLEGNDTLHGNAGNDSLVGGEGNDFLNGGTGADSMAGNTGDDTYVVDNAGDAVNEAAGEGLDTVQSSIDYSLTSEVENLTLTGNALVSGTGNELDNTIIGNISSNALYGGLGNDTLTDAAGNDRLDGGLGADSMSGGAGNDTYVVDNAGDLVTEGVNTGVDTVESSIDYTLAANVDNLVLTGSSDLVGHGNALNNVITGNSGNNITSAGAGIDTVNAGEGNDVASGGDGNDALNGEAGDDQLDGDAGNDLLNGGLGSDRMAGGLGDDTFVVDNDGDIVLEAGTAGTDVVNSSITYTLTDNVENLVLTGAADINGSGNELNNIINGNLGANVLDGKAGNDTINGNVGADTLVGGEGNDALSGDAGDDALNGDAGNDVLNGGVGADTMAGGSGDDTYIVDSAADVVNELEAEGLDTVQAGVNHTLADNVENLVLTGTVNTNGAGNALDNVITGNAGSNQLNGGAGNDTLLAGIGNDTLDGGTGADNLQGGAGNDGYVVDEAGDVVLEALNAGTDTVTSSIDYVLGANLENLVLAGLDDLDGTGNALGNIITGNAGANLIDGGAGADSMSGGAGDDTFIVDVSSDLANEAVGGGTDTVRAGASFTLGANVEHLVLTGTAASNGTGNALDNTITGNDAANTLAGGAGSDTINAAGGNDTVDGGLGADAMSGGTGNDSYVVDDANDTTIEIAGEGLDSVLAGISHSLAAHIENLTLTGTGAIDGSGNELDNAVTGNAGANALLGGAGNDTLAGAAGNDTLAGGTGDDTYRFNRGDGADRVNDTQGADVLRFGANIVQGDLVATQSGNDLVLGIKGTADSVVLTGWLGQTEGVNRIVFDNGSSLDRAGMVGLLGGVPVALADSVTAREDGGVVQIAAADLLANDTNPAARLVSVGASTLGATVALAGDTVQYDIGARFQELAQGEVLKDSFTYTVRDNLGRTSTAVVNVQVTGSNDGPVATLDKATLDEAQAKAVNGNVLANDTDIDKGTVLQVANAGSFTGAYGTLVLAQDGSYTYTLDASIATAPAGGVLTERFDYTATDGIATSASTLEVKVTRANQAPGAGVDAVQVLEDGAATGGNLLANDSDADAGTTLKIAAPGSYAGTYGTLVVVADGSYSYTLDNGDARVQSLAQGQQLVETFGYAVTDGVASTGSTLTVTIAGTNDAPVVTADVAQALEGGAAASGNVLANDSDVDAGTVLAVAAPGSYAGTYGKLEIAADGSYSYTLDSGNAQVQALAQGQQLEESFGFAVTDGISATSSSLKITIAGSNGAPSVTADAAQASEDGPAASGNVLANDSDIDAGTSLKVAAPGSYAGAYGTLEIAADGSYTYILDNGAAAIQSLAQGQQLLDTFSYAVTDGIANTGSTLQVTIAGTNDAPAVTADTAQASEGSAIASGNVLANDSDLDAGSKLAVAAPGNYTGTYGVLEIAADGSYVYTLDSGDARIQALAQGQQLEESFGFSVTDGIVATGSSLKITIAGSNDAPVVSADTAQASEDGAVAASGNVLDNDKDADAGAQLAVVAPGTYEGAYGTLVLALDGSYTYRLHNNDAKVQSLAQGQVVVDSFSYAATDGSIAKEAVLQVTITGADDAPSVSADAAAVAEDGAVAATGNVLANDKDADAGAQLVVGTPGSYEGAYGTLVLAVDGSYTYSLHNDDAKVQSLAQGQSVVDSFTYAATDGAGSTSAALEFTITGANDAPVVSADVAQVAANGAVSASGNVLANDTDRDAGASLVLAEAGSFAGTYGSLVLAQDGSYTYTLDSDGAAVRALAAGQSAVDSFAYAATDGIASILSSLAITVNGANEAPVVALDTAAVAAGGPGASGNVLANDRDADADTQLRVATAGTYAGKYGSLALAADGSYTYVLDSASARVHALAQGESVVESFSYTATDGVVQVVSGLDITVTGTNDAPVVVADAGQVGAGGKAPVTGNVLANDRDVDTGTKLTVSTAGSYAGIYGTLELAQDGSYSYVVNSENAVVKALELGQSLVETFLYKASDGIVSKAANLEITINGEAQKPVLQADTASITEDQFIILGNVLSNDSGKSLKVVTDVDFGNYGVLTVLPNGSFVYALASLTDKVQSLGRNASVVDHFDYTVMDGRTAIASSMDVTVLGRNDAPELAKALSDKYINFNKAFSFQLPANSFTDIDKGDTLTYSAKLANGAALPSWLKFDAATGTFSGMAPKTTSTIEVRVTATDKVAATGSTAGSMSVSDVFKLSVSHGNNGWGNGEDAPPPGKDTDKDDFGGLADLWVNLLGGSSKLEVSLPGQDAAGSGTDGQAAMLVGVQAQDGFGFPVY